jgi:hypothetical protein
MAPGIVTVQSDVPGVGWGGVSAANEEGLACGHATAGAADEATAGDANIVAIPPMATTAAIPARAASGVLPDSIFAFLSLVTKLSTMCIVSKDYDDCRVVMEISERSASAACAQCSAVAPLASAT